jgi:hypothetical protein
MYLPHLYFNRPLVQGPADRYRRAVRVATDVLRGMAGVHAVFDRRALSLGQGTSDPLAQSVLLALDPERGGDLYVVFADGHQEPLPGGSVRPGGSHGSPWHGDTDVPFLLYGARVKLPPAGTGRRLVPVAAIAPTLARLLDLPPPSAAEAAPLTDLVGP